MRHFCTYFDKNYLSRGLTLYESLRRYQPSFRLYVGCFDEQTREYLTARALPEVVVLSERELETFDPQLAATRATRSRVEYFFTSTPSWLRYIFARFADVDLLTYVDADIALFASAEPVFAETAAAPVAIVEHRYPPSLRHLEPLGRFNVGWLSFRRVPEGQACLDWWRERCLEWCYDRVEDDKFGDQKYLDQWPTLFPSLAIIRHGGVDVAPWNVEGRDLAVDDGEVKIDGAPLVCFHFQGLKHVFGPLYESGLRAFGMKLSSPLRAHVFEPYIAALARHEAELRRAGLTGGHAKSQRIVGRAKLFQRATRVVTIARLLLSGTYLLLPRAQRASP